MKGGIEACDLHQVRTACEQSSDRRQVVGLMQRRQRDVTLQPRQHVCVYESRPVVFRTTMHDAMADNSKIDRLRIAQPMARGYNRRRDVRDFVRGVMLVDQNRPFARLSRS